MEPRKTTSERLRELTVAQHVSTRWIQGEIAKHVPIVQGLETDRYLWAGGGFGLGLVLLVLVVFS